MKRAAWRAAWRAAGKAVLAGGAAAAPLLVVWLLPLARRPDVAGATLLGGAALRAFLEAALPEEAAKLAGLLWLGVGLRPRVSGRGAVIRGFLLGLGFALVEVAAASGAGSAAVAADRGLLVARLFTAVPCHCFLGAVMAHYLARFADSRSRRWLAKAFLVPFCLHGLYDLPLLVAGNDAPAAAATDLLLSGLVLTLLAAWTRQLLGTRDAQPVPAQASTAGGGVRRLPE